ncbi:MAG TPA: cupin domain-containing protein [Sedimentisphaerales bacterium]|nr:cupin domain-containing protein [Sedimentisphaerales bacterium]
MDVINLKEKGAQIPNLYQYEVIAKMNNHNFTLVRVKDRTLDFHTHPESDEVFLIVDGTMKLEFKNKIVELNAGEMCVVPRGVEHRPICASEVTCMLIEAEGTLTPENTGGTYKG